MIDWNIDPELIRLGPFAIRYYSLAFIIGFFLGKRYCSRYLVGKNGFTKDHMAALVYYAVFGTIIGARLGHCLFYEPGYYLSNPIKILYIWKGGLASHGGFLGVIIALYLFRKRVKDTPFVPLLDLLAAPSLMTGGFIRLGNLMNSEILGMPTDGTWGFIFRRIDDIPRHPAQLYESFGFFMVSAIGFWLYKKYHKTAAPGRFLGFIFAGGFSWRFFIEFFKENQVAFEQGMTLNMGQLLSIPMIIAGIVLMLRKPKQAAVATQKA